MAKVDPHRLAARVAGNPAEFTVSVINGGPPATDISLPGIAKHDGLLSVLDFQPPTATNSAEVGSLDHVDATTISNYGSIQISGTVDTTGEQLLVFWYDFD